LEKAAILPSTVYYSPLLTDDGAERQAYFQQLWHLVQDCDLVFFDPDNGLEIKSVPYGRKNSSKSSTSIGKNSPTHTVPGIRFWSTSTLPGKSVRRS
jgi:hypothetical protein